MKVWGVGEYTIRYLAVRGDLCAESIKKQGAALSFHLVPESTKYARRAAPSLSGKPGRRLRSVCHHGMRNFIRGLFHYEATRVKSAAGDWKSADAFERDLYRLANINIGSTDRPCRIIDTCDCKRKEGSC